MTNVTVMQRARTTIVLHPDVVIKTYNEAEWAANEIAFYHLVPWACPPLLYADNGTIVTQTMPLASNNPDYRPTKQLVELLTRLEGHGINHRDVHPANIVIGPTGPLLIDWECAVVAAGAPSYDLHGPHRSSVPIPDIHRDCGPQWLGSPDPSSITNTWGQFCATPPTGTQTQTDAPTPLSPGVKRTRLRRKPSSTSGR